MNNGGTYGQAISIAGKFDVIIIFALLIHVFGNDKAELGFHIVRVYLLDTTLLMYKIVLRN